MKHIHTPADLAINGAPPAFSNQKHVGGPNIGSKAKFLSNVEKMFESGWVANIGPLVKEFEQKIADTHQVKHCIAMCNGTVALEIAIRSLQLSGEVIVPSYTFVATAHALSWQAIRPVFADIDPVTHTLDPAAVRKLITPNTSGILGVHLWGRPAPVEELSHIADEYGLRLMFDAAHAFSCSHRGEMIGGFGECEVVSFHATKFLNSFEGGAVLTNNDELAEKIRLMRNFGFQGRDNVIYPGTNGKMIEVAAAMGLANLEMLDDFLVHNKANYRRYQECMTQIPGVNLLSFDENEKNNYQYIVLELEENLVEHRDRLIEGLHAENVLARKYFWPGVHNMMPYCETDPDADRNLPATNAVAERVIVLPTGLSISLRDVDTIVEIIGALLRV